MKNYYETLGLQEGASQEEIQNAYERLSDELDPKNNNNQEFFKEEYKKVQEAYKALANYSILATEKGAKNPKKTSSHVKQKESLKNQIPKTNSKASKRDYAFGSLLFFIAIGIWGIFLQNMGFLVPSNDYTQKVRVINTVDTYSNGGSVEVSGSVDVSGSVEVENTVSISIDEVLKPDGKKYYYNND
jgi:preprotein translocase subunit Sec63